MEIASKEKGFALPSEELWAGSEGGAVSGGGNFCGGEGALEKRVGHDSGSAGCTGVEKKDSGVAKAGGAGLARAGGLSGCKLC